MNKARQFIKDYTRGCSNELCAVEDRYGKKVISYHEWLTPEQALAAVEIARKELIEKACDAYCKVCDTQECEGICECIWVQRFRKQLMK